MVLEVNVLHIWRCESVSKMMMMISAWKLGWAADRIQRLADRDGGARNFPQPLPLPPGQRLETAFRMYRRL